MHRAVSVTGPSGSGKTTLVCALIAEFGRRHAQVAAVKHGAHRIELDTEGKDSWRLRDAGASPTLLVGPDQLAWFGTPAQQPTLGALVALFGSDIDIVLVEGYRSAGLDCIVIDDPRSDRDWERPAPDRVLLSVPAHDGPTWPDPALVSKVADAIERRPHNP